MTKLIFLIYGMFSLILPLINADLIIPLVDSNKMMSLILLVIIIEIIVFWLLSEYLFKTKIRFWKIVLIVFVANIATSFIGTFVPGPYHGASRLNYIPQSSDFTDFVFYFILSIITAIIEFGVFVLFFLKNKGKEKIKKLNLLWISLIINFISYTMLFLFFPIF